MTMMVRIALVGKDDWDAAGHHDGPPLTEGTSDSDDGMRNSPGPSRGGPGPSRPEGSPRPPPQGFVNGAVPSAPSGLETRVDLINGNPARTGAARRGRRRWWGARSGRAAREALAERARGPLPGTSGEDPRDERD
jgi:hypothetical protein